MKRIKAEKKGKYTFSLIHNYPYVEIGPRILQCVEHYPRCLLLTGDRDKNIRREVAEEIIKEIGHATK